MFCQVDSISGVHLSSLLCSIWCLCWSWCLILMQN